MAEALQREHGLRVLKVRLGHDAVTPMVRVECVDHSGGSEAPAEVSVPLRDFIGQEPNPNNPGAVPPAVVALARRWRMSIGDDGSALWLHLVKPYGRLGGIPWERDLVPAVGPLLRLPDVRPSPRATAGVPVVAIVAADEDGRSALPAWRAAVATATSIHAALGGAVETHLFVEEAVRKAAEAGLTAGGVAGAIVRSPTEEALRAARVDGQSSRTAHSGWLTWMRDTLAQHPVDVLHLVVDGAELGVRGAVTLPRAASPTEAGSVAVGSREMATIATQVGAQLVSFTLTGSTSAERGLRMLADEMGATRAGPVVVHDARLDPTYAAVGGVAAMLVSTEAAEPVASAALSMHVQPAHVLQAGRPDMKGERPTALPEGLPAWAIAAQRYLEEQRLAMARFERVRDAGSASAGDIAHYEGVREAVEQADAWLADYLEERV